MAKITKQWLQKKIAAMESTRDEIPFGLDEDDSNTLAAMKITLASLEAEDKLSSFVASQVSLGGEFEKVLAENLHDLYVDCDNSKPAPKSEAVYQVCKEAGIWVDIESYDVFSLQSNGEQVRTLYSAPPAPVPIDERIAFEAFMESRFKDTIDRKRVKNGDQGYFAWDMIVAWIVWQHRAAMLQSFGNSEQLEPVTTAYKLPDGWVAVPVDPTYQMCEAMGLPWESPRFPDRYKAMIASAPQQEVK